MSLDVLHLNTAPTEQDWVELSSYAPAPDGFQWRDMLTEQDIAASHGYGDDVRQLLHSMPGAHARLQELGELLLVATVREAMRLAVCVLRLEELGELRRAHGDAFTSSRP